MEAIGMVGILGDDRIAANSYWLIRSVSACTVSGAFPFKRLFTNT